MYAQVTGGSEAANRGDDTSPEGEAQQNSDQAANPATEFTLGQAECEGDGH